MQDVYYAGFWIRFVGYFIDSIIIIPVVWIISMISMIFSFALGITTGGWMWMGANHDSIQSMVAIFDGVSEPIIYIAGTWLYFALQYSSRFQATVGMRCVNIQVVDYDYQRLSFGRATGRHFAKYLSFLTLTVGYIMIVFTKRRQGLHDFIAKTYVVYK